MYMCTTLPAFHLVPSAFHEYINEILETSSMTFQSSTSRPARANERLGLHACITNLSGSLACGYCTSYCSMIITVAALLIEI
jgi:heterodisulfide reductase subunit C